MHLDRAVYVLGVFVLFLVSAACRCKQPNNELGSPVTSQQQTIALKATERLRDQWNHGACEAVYDQAAAGFRSQPLPDWLVYCEYARRKLGFWESFVLQEALSCSGTASVVVCLDGKAKFGNERYDALIAWVMENRQPRFGYLSVGQNGKAIETIPHGQQHLVDPPPPPGSARRG